MSIKGIYSYTDTQTNEIVYIGKDSKINRKNRHYNHIVKKSNQQQIDKVLQNNPNRYKYEVICQSEHYSNTYLNCLEKGLIKLYSPKFNFTEGGEGIFGFEHSKETKQKISNSLKGHVVSKETRKKLSLKNKGYVHTPEAREKISEKQTNQPTVNLSKTLNNTGYYRVSKIKDPTCTQGFRFGYRYNVDKKAKVISSVDIEKLKEKVLAKGLEWIEFNKED